MKKKKRTRSSKTNIEIGDITDVSGQVNVAGGNIRTTQSTTTGLRAAEIRELFDQLYAKIDFHPNTSPMEKQDLKGEVEQIHVSVKMSKKVDENWLSHRFRNIARVAPDVLDIVVATLANPLAGLGVAAKKIAEKAKAEAK